MRKWRLENKGWCISFKGKEIGQQVDGVQGSRELGNFEIRCGTKGKPFYVRPLHFRSLKPIPLNS